MNRLKEIREDNDLLQKDVAKMINVTQTLATYYKTSIDYLLYRTDERKPYPKSIVK